MKSKYSDRNVILRALNAHKNPQKKYFTSSDLKENLGVSKSHINNMVKTGLLVPIRITGKENEPFRFHIDDIIEHLVTINSK